MSYIKGLIESFTEMNDQQWDDVLSIIKVEKIKKGDSFLTVGDTSDRFAVVEEGLFRIFYVDSEGKEAIKTFRAEGGIIGAYAEFLRQIPSRLTVQALSDSRITVIKASDMHALFMKSAQWERVGRRITESLYVEKEEREYQFLCMDAKARYQAFLKEYKDAESKIPDYMVASYLGITPVYLSKLKKG